MKKIMMISTFFALLAGSFSAGAVEVGDQAPAVVIDHYQNGQTTQHAVTAPQKDGRPVFVEFFSIYCGACIANLPNLKVLAEKMNATVRLVSLDKKIDKVLDFIKEHELTMEVALDKNQEAGKAYDIKYTPTSFLVLPSGVIAEKHIGTFDEASLNELIEKANSL